MTVDDALFTPLRIGDITLSHRVVFAPLTRYRSPDHVPGKLNVEYYSQRATPGGLLIAETTYINGFSGNNPHTPRIDLPESVEGWKKVTAAVHAKQGYIFLQLNHTGRAAVPQFNGGRQPISCTDEPVDGKPRNYPREAGELEFAKPRIMTADDMAEVTAAFAAAATNAIEAGFDGVEIHSANGYLLEQHLCDNINIRTDEFGGTSENRARFPLMVLKAVCNAIGASRVGVRLSPWGEFLGTKSSDPVDHWLPYVTELEKLGLGYVHIIEPRSDSNGGFANDNNEVKRSRLAQLAETKGVPIEEVASIKPLRRALKTTPVISAGGWNATNFEGAVGEGEQADALAFGRWYTSNPDLVYRLRNHKALAPYERTKFYVHLDPDGYTTFPTCAEQE